MLQASPAKRQHTDPVVSAVVESAALRAWASLYTTVPGMARSILATIVLPHLQNHADGIVSRVGPGRLRPRAGGKT